MRAARWFRSSTIRALLGSLVLSAVLTIGLATNARANRVTDQLKDCMGIVGAVIDGVDAAAEGSLKIANALADPTYAQCVSQAAAGDPFTIAAMAAMTGIYVATTAGGNEPFTDPASCNAAIGGFVAGQIADFLSGLIEDPDSLIGGALRSMLPEAAIEVINSVAHQAAGDIGKALSDKFMAALGPIGDYLKCGCAAAGTAAILKNVAEDIAQAAAKAGKGAEACADLAGMIFDDPKAVVGALFDDPGAVVTAVVDAVCGINKTTKEICGAIGEVYETAKEVCDAVNVCPGLEVIWGGVKDVGHSIGCFFKSCSDDPPAAATGPPATCAPGATYQTLADTRTCSCSLPNGWKTVWTNIYSSLNGGYIPTQVYSCTACTSAETNVDGWCRACPHGFNRDAATGQCSRPIICSPGSLINADNTGCWSCPAGFQFNTGGTGCTPSCAARPWLQYNAAANDKPAGYNDAMFAPYAGGACQCPSGQYDTGSSCAPVPVCASGSFDQKAGRCIPSCGDDAVPSGRVINGVETCDLCPSGQRNIDGTCRTPCASDQIRSGDSCMTCPSGTQISGGRGGNGEYLSCASVCGPGSMFQAGPFQLVTQANGNVGAGLQGTQAPGAANGLATAGNLGGNQIIGGVEIAIQSRLPGGGMVGSAGSGGQTAAPATCRPCADNERTVAVTVITASGGSITQNQCLACPPGQVGSRNGDQCVGRVAGLFPAIRRAVPRDVGTPTREAPARTAPQRPAAPTERAVPARPRPAAVQPAAVREPLRCPPGRVPNRAGTACVLDVGDFDRGPGGSSVGGRSGR